MFLNEEKGTHVRNAEICKSGSNIAALAWRNNYSTDFNNARVIDQGIFRIAVIRVEPAVKHFFVKKDTQTRRKGLIRLVSMSNR